MNVRHLFYQWLSPRAWRYWRDIHQRALRERDYWRSRAEEAERGL